MFGFVQIINRTKFSCCRNSSRYASRRTVRKIKLFFFLHFVCRWFFFSFSLTRYKEFKEFQTRILVATNLFGRGMDIERVNIVFNYDMPESTDTYLHRVSFSFLFFFFNVKNENVRFSLVKVARAGRFGTKGLAITFIADENDTAVLNEVQKRFVVQITEMPDEIDVATYSKIVVFLSQI